MRLRVPSDHDGLRRLDRVSGEEHRPATAITDAIAANQNDPVAQALWRAHIERALISARKLKAGWPQPRLSLRDPMALRALTLILVVATFFAASGERMKRITAAFDWQGVVAPANFRIDAWVTPPLYTGRPPVMLPGLRPGDVAQNAAEPVAVPAGSQLVIRSTGKVSFDIVRVGGLEETPADAKAPLPAGTEEAPLYDQGRWLGDTERARTRQSGVDVQCDPRSRTEHLPDQGSGDGRRAAPCGSITAWTTTTASPKPRRSLLKDRARQWTP